MRERDLLEAAPTSVAELRAWLDAVLDIQVAETPRLDGHDAPLAYLAHTFLGPPPGVPADCVVWANRGGGKTFYGAVATLLDMLFRPGIEVMVLGGSLEQSQRMHAHLRALLDRELVAPVVDGRITDRRVAFTNRSVCRVLAQSEASVRGVRPQKLRCDEVELFDPEVWRAAQLAPRSKRCGAFEIPGAVEALSTMHRPFGLMSEIVESCGEGGARRLFRWGVVDVLETCPPARDCETCDLLPECAGRAKRGVGHVPIDDALRQKSRVGAGAWESEMLCARPRRDDLVFSEFDRAVHVADFEPSPRHEVLCGMDFGFRAPTVILWATVDSEGTLRIIDERSEREALLESHIRSITNGRWPIPRWIGIDPAGRQRNDQTGLSAAGALRRAGLSVRDRRVSIGAGVAAVKARLRPAVGGPRLFIHARCARLIESLERHHYRVDQPESEIPVKDGTDHAADALRYLVVNLDAAEERAERRRYW